MTTTTTPEGAGEFPPLPCPFCGGTPEIVDNRMGFFVRCNQCKPFATVIYGENVRHIDHLQSDDEAIAACANVDWTALRRSAIDAWNRRAPVALRAQAAEGDEGTMVDMTPPATARDRWMYNEGRKAERDPRTPGTRAALIEEFCARIKAADDAAADGDYMLDSNDCISVLRGTWTAPLANDCPKAPAGEQSAASAAGQEAFQQRVKPWLLECFGEAIAGDREERNHRFLEEALELVQACGCTASEAHQLVDYTFGRPVGEKTQEVGGVMVTLAALCLAHDIDMHAEGETELARIWTMVEKIRAKQAAKPKHSPLPEQPPASPDAGAGAVLASMPEGVGK